MAHTEAGSLMPEVVSKCRFLFKEKAFLVELGSAQLACQWEADGSESSPSSSARTVLHKLLTSAVHERRLTTPPLLSFSVIDMRLIFSTNNHMNTDISDEREYIHYTISTPSAFKKVTTITKYRWSGSRGVPETMGVIEWHRLKETVFQFDGNVIPANVMLEKRTWSSGRYFVGPDQHTYKWKLESTHCWMKPAESDVELVRFHKKNLGILKPSHPAYLDVSTKVVPMLDHIILTFVYVESLRQEQAGSQSNLNNTNNTNNTNMTTM